MKSFISTKGGTLWIWNVDCVVWERWKELLIFDVLDFRVIYCEIWPAVRMIQILHWMGFKIRGNSELFKTDWFSWMGIVSVLTTIVIHSWA